MLVRNAIKTPDGTILESHSSHDFVSHHDKNGEVYFIDGGLSYIRGSVNKEPAEELYVYTTDGHEKVREAFSWGTYGPLGDQPKKYVRLADMTSEHIQAILETQWHISDEVRQIFEDELEWRENES